MGFAGVGQISRVAGAALLSCALGLSAPALASAGRKAPGGPGGPVPKGGASVTGTVPVAIKTSGGSQHLGDRALRRGMRGHDVRILQDFLTRAGYPTPVVGVFGPVTDANVRSFERDQHLTADGVVSPVIAQVLRAAVAKAQGAIGGPVGRAHLNGDGTVSPPADAPKAIREVIAAANRIATTPYIYGGGHATWNDSGYDCSGSVSFALHGANLIDAPQDSGELESYGSPGPGRWITIWANAGHTYMRIAGLWFDTVAQSSSDSNDRWSSTRASAPDGFVVRHPTGF